MSAFNGPIDVDYRCENGLLTRSSLLSFPLFPHLTPFPLFPHLTPFPPIPTPFSQSFPLPLVPPPSPKKLNTFLPSSLLRTYPLRPIGSRSQLPNSASVRASAWFAMNRAPFAFRRPTMWPRWGWFSRVYSRVYVWEAGGKLKIKEREKKKRKKRRNVGEKGMGEKV